LPGFFSYRLALKASHQWSSNVAGDDRNLSHTMDLAGSGLLSGAAVNEIAERAEGRV
jgi:hypothetical protein